MAMRKIKPRSPDELQGHLAGTSDSSKKEKIYPRFRIELVHLPEAKKWEIGKEYTVTLKLKQTGLSISKFQNEAEFDIIGIDAHQSNDYNKED